MSGNIVCCSIIYLIFSCKKSYANTAQARYMWEVGYVGAGCRCTTWHATQGVNRRKSMYLVVTQVLGKIYSASRCIGYLCRMAYHAGLLHVATSLVDNHCSVWPRDTQLNVDPAQCTVNCRLMNTPNVTVTSVLYIVRLFNNCRAQLR